MLQLLILILFPSLYTCEEVQSVCNRTEVYFVKVNQTGYHMITYAKRFKTCTSFGFFGDSCRTYYKTRTKSAPYTFQKERLHFRKEFFCCPGFFGEPPNCQRLCDRLDHPPNGIVKFFNKEGKLKERKDVPIVFPEYAAYYKCDSTYSMEGDRLRTCKDGGKGWNGTEPSCLAPCPYKFPPRNGHLYYSVETRPLELVAKSPRRKGTIQYVRCDIGFRLVGDSVRKCQVKEGSLQWSGQQPTCKTESCGDPGIPMNGARFGDGFTYTTVPIFFKCDDGFAIVGSNARRCEHDAKFSGTQPVCKPILDTCEGAGSIVLDECNRRCECDEDNQLVECTRVRKSWTKLSSDEKQRYIDAVKTLTTTEQYKERYEALQRNYTQDIAKVNAQRFERHHTRMIFNSFYLVHYENLLREIDCRITIPYWDWTAFHKTPYKHPVWDNTLGFGNSSRLWDKCVSSGPFNYSVFSIPKNRPRKINTDYSTLRHIINPDMFVGDPKTDQERIWQELVFRQQHRNFGQMQEEEDEQVDTDHEFDIPEDWSIGLMDIYKHYFDSKPEPQPLCLKREYHKYKQNHYGGSTTHNGVFPNLQSRPITELLIFDHYIGSHQSYHKLTENFLYHLNNKAEEVLCQVGGHLCSVHERAYDPIYPLHVSFIDFLYNIWNSFSFHTDVSEFFDPPSDLTLPGGVSVSYDVSDIQD